MKNTLENKAKFFAQYWGQEVLNYENNTVYTFVDYNVLNTANNNSACSFLELKPLSSITDENAIYVGKLFGHSDGNWSDEYCLFVGKRISKNFQLSKVELEINYIISIADYLRSKGYALPYMGLSVEKQVEYGWVKLEELQND